MCWLPELPGESESKLQKTWLPTVLRWLPIIHTPKDSAEQTVEEIEKAGGSATMSEFDVSKFDAVQEGIGTVIEKYGRIDILINNAGITKDPALSKDE